MNGIRRGLRDIRTFSGRVGKVKAPHNGFLRISHIELEKARRKVERDAASQLIADIDERLAEIEAEKNSILRWLEREPSETGDATEENRPPTGFVIKY